MCLDLDYCDLIIVDFRARVTLHAKNISSKKIECSVSFRVATPGGGRDGYVPGGADEKFLPRRPTDTKRRCKVFDDLFSLISPIFSQSPLFPSSTSSLRRSSRPPTQTQRKIFSPLRPRADRPNAPPPPLNTPPLPTTKSGAKPQKNFFVTFPRGGPTARPGRQSPPGRMPE
jgi:hypothetical protein